MDKRKIISTASLLLAAIIWGFAFVAQDKASDNIGPFTLNGLRCIIGSLVLIPVILVTSKITKRPLLEKTKADRKVLIKAGVLCGIFLSIAANFQQFGISLYPDGANVSGRSGFITALYILIVPIFGLFFKKKVSLHVWFCVILATVGLYILCFSTGIGSIYLGDLVVLMCAVTFSMQIICVDHYGSMVDGVKLSCVQFFTCGIISLTLMLIFEKPDINSIMLAWKSILYLGMMSSGMGYTLQIIGQQYSDSPTVASILMSFESVFAAIGGAIFVGQILSGRELLGCSLMFVAIILAQIPLNKILKKSKS